MARARSLHTRGVLEDKSRHFLPRYLPVGPSAVLQPGELPRHFLAYRCTAGGVVVSSVVPGAPVSSILIDTASDADARALCRIYTDVLREGRWFITHVDEYTGTEESHAKAIRDRNSETNSRLLVARFEQQVVGALSITGGGLERTRHVGMIELYVAREARGRGVGRALMEAGLIWSQSNPILRKLALHVFEDNTRAVKLYSDLGFRTEGRLVNEFMEEDGSLRHDLMMALSV